jgi:hypothetical protein
MSISKLLTVTTIIAFTLIKKANFNLDPDNIALFATVAFVAFISKYFYNRLLQSADLTQINRIEQSFSLSS